MANTNLLSPKPGIKCYVGNNKLRDTPLNNTVKTTRVSLRKLTSEEILWTGESTLCVCGHRVEQHCTRDHCDRIINSHCHDNNNELCNCKFFMPRSIRLSHSNCYKMVTERLAGDFEVLEGYQTHNEVKNQ